MRAHSVGVTVIHIFFNNCYNLECKSICIFNDSTHRDRFMYLCVDNLKDI